MPTPTAPLIASYTSPPLPHSLSLITSILGATSNWLVLRFLCDALSQVEGENEENTGLSGGSGRGTTLTVGKKRRRVVLLSFLRGWEFWKTEARRIGLDLTRLASERNFLFIDGVSDLFAPEATSTNSTSTTAAPSDIRSSNVASRTPPRQNGSLPIRPSRPDVRNELPGDWRKLRWDKKGGLDALEKEIVSALQPFKSVTAGDGSEEGILLVIDQPDFLLAATGPGLGVGGTELLELVMGLRQHVDSTIVTLASDSPLVHNASSIPAQPTPLETEHASLVVALAHQSRMVMQLRELDTGVARDVSGVLRISKGGGWEEASEPQEGKSTHAQWEEKEVLYFVQSDGAVRAFGRGE